MNRRKSMQREAVSIYEMSSVMNSKLSERELAELPRDFFQYRPKLYKELVVPSYVHGYSLAIEYMRNWFLNKFEDSNYFKSINVNGRHVLTEWKHFNKLNIVREKPMLAIIPQLEFDHDRDTLDIYQADRRLLLHRSDFQQSFLRDYKNKRFLYCQPRELKMNFTFKVRVGSRSEQIDLWHKMELYFRVGATQTDYISADIHIPHDIMIALAKACGFCIDKNGEVVNVFEFISYCNKHSDIPIIFKMRAINQRPEFFMRASNLRVHISCKDKIQADDGEKEGRLDNNFHLELQATVSMPVPHFFVFFNQDPIIHKIEVGNESIGIYSINTFEIPPETEKGWLQKVQTNYLVDKGDEFIDLHPIFDGPGDMCEVMRYNLKNFISPDSFIEVRVYKSNTDTILMKGSMDYRNLCFIFDEPAQEEVMTNIVIYADNEYINNTQIMLNNYHKSRIDKPEDTPRT